MLVSSSDEEIAIKTLKNIFDDVSVIVKEQANDVLYFSAMKSPVKRIQTKYRMQILMRIKDNQDKITSKVYEIVDKYHLPKVSVFVEINPNNLG